MPSPTTAVDIITRAMRHINVLAVGETPTAAELADGLDSLNDVIETWNTQGLAIYGSLPVSFTTVPGTNTYTMGAGGTWGTVRPENIDAAYCTVSGVDFPVAEWPLEQWMGQPVKDMQQQIIERFVYVNDFPQGQIILWPTPQQAITFTVSFSQQITQATDGATSFNLPPGYARALHYAVAVEMTPEYGGEDVSAYAKATFAVVKRSNRRTPISSFDSALLGGGRMIPARGY